MEGLIELLQREDILHLFVEVSKQNPEAKYKLVQKLGEARLPRPGNIKKETYEKYEEDIRQEFLMKIWEGKIHYKEGKNLKNYIITIVSNLWVDVIRKETHISHAYKEEGEHSVKNLPRVRSESSLPVPLEELKESKKNFSMPELKEYRKQEICSLPAGIRIVIKMWMPYLWNYSFEADEEDILVNKHGLEITSLTSFLQEETTKFIEKDKSYISTSIIAQTLNLSRDCVDQMLCRAKKRLPWLGNIRQELE